MTPTTWIQTENIDLYMNDIRIYKRISTSEEAMLAEVIANGNADERSKAVEKLICSNLRLVVKIAHGFKALGLGLADLISAGNIGLMTAAERFDPSKGAKFSCYSAWWIKQAMRKAVAWQAHTIRVPIGSMQKILRIDHARCMLLSKLDREPTMQELAEASGLSEHVVRQLSRCSCDTVSLDELVSTDSATTFDQTMPDTASVESSERDCRIRTVASSLEELTQLDRYIVCRMYGIDCGTAVIRDIAQETGLSMADAQTRLDRALLSLRAILSDRL